MKLSEQTAELMAALSMFQADVTNPPATANNPFFKSKYTPLDDLLALMRPLLSKYGLSVSQSPCSKDGEIGVVTMLMHKSGQYMECEPYFAKPSKQDPQMAGSAITYARRYTLSAVLGIATDTDDDGNLASGKQENTPAPSASNPPKKPAYICPKCGKEVVAQKSSKTGELTFPNEILTKCGGVCTTCYTAANKAKKSE